MDSVVASLIESGYSVRLVSFTALDRFCGLRPGPARFLETDADLAALSRLFDTLRFPGAALADSAATAGQAADETPVVLQGHLLKRLKGDTYEFRDASGSLQVEIDDDAWPLQAIDATTRVRLSGEVDRELFGREVLDDTGLLEEVERGVREDEGDDGRVRLAGAGERALGVRHRDRTQ